MLHAYKHQILKHSTIKTFTYSSNSTKSHNHTYFTDINEHFNFKTATNSPISLHFKATKFPTVQSSKHRKFTITTNHISIQFTTEFQTTNLTLPLDEEVSQVRRGDQKPAVMRERREPLAVARHHHLLQRSPEQIPAEPLHAVLLNGEHRSILLAIANTEQNLNVPGHRVLRLDDGHTTRRLEDSGIGELNRVRVFEIGDAEQLVGFGDANDAVSPEGAIGDVVLEALLAER